MTAEWENTLMEIERGNEMCIRDSRDTGWYLRNDIIWMKDNPMPESVKDRCARCYEHIFLFSKSRKYHFDHLAISEPIAPGTCLLYTSRCV